MTNSYELVKKASHFFIPELSPSYTLMLYLLSMANHATR